MSGSGDVQRSLLVRITRAATINDFAWLGTALGGTPTIVERLPTPPQTDNEVADDIDALRREVRRLRGEVLRLEDDKRELEKRIAHFQREVEQLRAKVPRGMSTS